MRRRERKRLKEEEALLGNNVCRLCKEEANEELFGKFFVEKQSGFSVHQYCMFFSSGLAQRGEDDEGFDGFLIKDIKKEISRSRRLRCNFCKMHGASIGCCESRCHQAFHYKCGRERGSLFQFFDSFNSYCVYHRPTQNVILAESKNQTCPICRCEIEWDSCRSLADVPLVVPCCKKSWFHNNCLQRHAQSSGLYYFRCPMCNNMDKFQEEMKRMGIFIPEQDASWEKDDAFADLLFQYSRCDAQKCSCPYGREHKGTSGKWRIRLCDTCGQFGTHLSCQHWRKSPGEWHCDVCGNTLPYSSTRQRPVGDHSMDPYTSDEEQSSSSTEDCEVNVCTLSDDDVPLATLRRNQEESVQLQSSVEAHVREGASPMRKRRRLSSEQGTPNKAGPNSHDENHLRKSPTGASLFKDLLNSTSVPSSVWFAFSDAVLGGATMTEETNSTAVPVEITKEREAIVIRDTDSECASDAGEEDLKICTEKGKSSGNAKCEQDDSSSNSSETVDAEKVKSPRRRQQNLQKLKRLTVVPVVEAEADSSATDVKVLSDPMVSEVKLLNFENKQEPFDSDDDSCLITKVVKKPCPLGNDKFGKCFLRCCNPAGYFCPDVIATSSKGTSCKCKDLQSQTVSSTSSCCHVEENSDKSQKQNLPSARTNAAIDEDCPIPIKECCSVSTNTKPFKPRKQLPTMARQTKITQTYFPKGKTPVSPSDQNRRLNLRSKKNGSYLERSLEKFYSLRKHHMTVSHKCFR